MRSLTLSMKVLSKGFTNEPQPVFPRILPCSMVEDRRISVIAEDITLPKAGFDIDVEGNSVLLGLIDSHVHVRDPGTTFKEDFKSDTKALMQDILQHSRC